MKMKRKLALLASCALVMQNVAATLPAQAFDTEDNMAAIRYSKRPLCGGPDQQTEPAYGFSVGQPHGGWLFAPPEDPRVDDNSGSQTVMMPALFDLHFGGAQDSLPSVSFSGVDVVPVITGQLNAI